MDEYYSLVGAKGEIEIPAAFCESLGIVDGTRVVVCVDSGRIILQFEPERPEEKCYH